jgi:hypothetical protein
MRENVLLFVDSLRDPIVMCVPGGAQHASVRLETTKALGIEF